MKNQRKIKKKKKTFTILTKTMKYLGITLPRERKDIYAENYKTLMKAIRDTME